MKKVITSIAFLIVLMLLVAPTAALADGSCDGIPWYDGVGEYDGIPWYDGVGEYDGIPWYDGVGEYDGIPWYDGVCQ